ncbi:DENN domain-containing protein 3-like isoform X2 [Lineus longissimus]|uniref:DENN domain-containing protein 3-like isoform X2 n=1 Tax=Lineus longissimus TaxID=88925 RepID=UPI002B4E3E57
MMSTKLHNCLAEMLVAVGMDMDSGLHPSNEPADPDDLSIHGIYHERFDPQVIAAITKTTATFPQAQMQTDWRYPPPEMNPNRRKGHGRNENSLMMRKRMSRKFSTIPTDHLAIRRQSRRISSKPTPSAEVIISPDIVNSLPTLCFPEGAYVSSIKSPEQVQYQVLTDITGNRTYATCLTLYRPFIAKKSRSGATFNLQHEDAGVTQESDEVKCYVPVCLILISKYPYLTVLKDCLSTIVPRIGYNPEDLSSYLKELAIRVTMTPVPPAGRLGLTFDLFGAKILLHPSDYPDKPVVDIPLSCVFFCFSLDTILRILSCLLTMQRIVFMSSNYALLTVISESFLSFILPFHWRFTYVPVLPDRLLELIDAPGTYILGCHSSHRDEIEQVEGLVTVDIDNGTVHICETIECSIPDIPVEPATKFREVCKRARLHYELEEVRSPSPQSAEEAMAARQKHTQQFHRDILAASLELMVNLFREVTFNLNVERSYFNMEGFLQSQAEEDRQFYQDVVKTDMFNRFLRERLGQKRDYWTALEDRTKSVLRPSIGMITDKGENRSSMRRSRRFGSVRPAVSLSARRQSTSYSLLIASNEVDIEVMVLPRYIQEGPGAKHFLERCIMEFTRKIDSSKSASLRASCLYLRGMVNLALGHLIESLEDFHSLGAQDTRLYPSAVFDETLAMLNHTNQSEQLTESSIYKTYMLNKVSNNLVPLEEEQDIQIEVNVVPEEDVTFYAFEEKIQLAEIAGDRDTIFRLFNALTVGKTLQSGQQEFLVDKDTFQIFYECWKENEDQCLSLNTPDDMLDANEGVMKVSSLIKTDKGSGRMMLTSKRLFYIQQGSDNYVEVIRLRDVENLEKIQVNAFLISVDAIKIHNKDKKKAPFMACLKEERNQWYLLIEEMRSGLVIADELKDPGIIQQAALNVLLLDAVIRSGNEPVASHHQNLEKAADGLCHFTKQIKDGGIVLPDPVTKEILQHRLNPNIRETEKSGVEVLLYTPGYNASERGPKLWCGMSNGKVKVYDASTWLLESEIPLANHMVVSLLNVDDSSVWAGSLDGVIYVIDMTSKVCNQQLKEHYHMISYITSSQDKTLVYSASVNGLIIIWNAEQLLKLRQIELADVYSLRNISIIDDSIWCGVKDEIRIISQAGDLLGKVRYTGADNRVVELDCFLVTDNGQVWTGCSRKKQMVVWDATTFEIIKVFEVDCRGFSKMVLVGDKIWAGSKAGILYIFDYHQLDLERKLKAHDDAIRSLCSAMSQYVVSGAGGSDGKIAIWRTSAMESATASLELEP